MNLIKKSLKNSIFLVLLCGSCSAMKRNQTEMRETDKGGHEEHQTLVAYDQSPASKSISPEDPQLQGLSRVFVEAILSDQELQALPPEIKEQVIDWRIRAAARFQREKDQHSQQ